MFLMSALLLIMTLKLYYCPWVKNASYSRAKYSRDGISIDQFISTAIAEKLSALMTENYLNERAKKGSRLKYEAILAKVPDVEPESYDRLPNV